MREQRIVAASNTSLCPTFFHDIVLLFIVSGKQQNSVNDNPPAVMKSALLY